ncbi:hypothetical protein HELRODRAFT_177097 [Helobdella robusta]|uniref:DDE-1 domain-containing protein n=1 Tax=Helobdella robusta TaxID=6412 RepID=T1FB81_HELRO|nr:hypothetical protein HELRODRAFT_177097 [Helobdella robusta]ESN98220.1 hypothetical protein HELRODRAFT_177097 [Helobdella robusta]
MLNKENVERVAVLISCGEEEELIGVPLLENGAGSTIAKSVYSEHGKWGALDKIQAMSFDTTAVNTGRIKVHHPRSDYKGLINLCLIFLERFPSENIVFAAPSAFHHARIMGNNEEYLMSKKIVDGLKVTNDTAKRGVKLITGLGWFRLFMKRHPSLSIRSPETCSLSRTTSFNRHNIGQFYKNLENSLENPSLLILDNHESHLSLPVIDLAKMKIFYRVLFQIVRILLLVDLVHLIICLDPALDKPCPVSVYPDPTLSGPCPSVSDHLDPTHNKFSSTSSYTGQLAPVTFLTPEQFKGYSKAGNRKTNNIGR